MKPPNKKLSDLIKRMQQIDASARVGALDSETAEKLSYAEFGTDTVPARPVLSETWGDAKAAVKRSIVKSVKNVVRGKKETGEQILGGVAEDLLELVQENIQGGFGDPLEDSTLKARRLRGNQDTRPLIDPSLLKSGEKTMADSLAVETKKGTGKWDS